MAGEPAEGEAGEPAEGEAGEPAARPYSDGANVWPCGGSEDMQSGADRIDLADDPWDQRGYRCRLAWGRRGAQAAPGRGDLLVMVGERLQRWPVTC